MINQELINRIESDIRDFGVVPGEYASKVIEMCKKLDEAHTQLERENSYLRLQLDKIARSDPGASGNVARKTLAPYGVAQNPQ